MERTHDIAQPLRAAGPHKVGRALRTRRGSSVRSLLCHRTIVVKRAVDSVIVIVVVIVDTLLVIKLKHEEGGAFLDAPNATQALRTDDVSDTRRREGARVASSTAARLSSVDLCGIGSGIVERGGAK